MKTQKGFTLIETMITLTVIGALTALAVPAYQDYTIKSQVAEAFVATEELKKEVELQKTLSDKFNIDLVKITNETLRVDEDGNVFYVFKDTNKAIKNKLVMFYLDENNSNNNVFKWNCLSDLDKKYLPSSVECIVDVVDNDNNNNNNNNDDGQQENKQKMSANFYLNDIIISLYTFENGDIVIYSEQNGDVLDKLILSKDNKKTSYFDYKNSSKNFEKDFNYDEMLIEAKKYSSKFYSDDLNYFISDIFEFDILDPESENYISK
ncbi:MAG TPA: prepilin-type N-terminal cleavage/methylation domain-containing protein [Alcaligenaceae bacterium]|nr:prepilin-type N-terminal cleavage/methylation domain-containing protein [Alcaligenaceae bacterium]